MHVKINKKTEIIDKAIVVAKTICTRKFKKQLMKKCMTYAFIFFLILIIYMLLQDIHAALRFFYIFPKYKRRFSQDMTGGPKTGDVPGGVQRSGDVW